MLSSKKKEQIFKMGGSVEKLNAKYLGPVFSLCRRARIDAALVRAHSLAGAPTIDSKIEHALQHAKVASANPKNLLRLF